MQIIQQLEATRDETLKFFQLGEPELSLCYAPEKWSVRFVLCHLADAETVLFDRIRRTLSEDRPVLWAFDPDACARAMDYLHLPLDLSRQIYTSTRASIIHHAHLHYEAQGHFEFVHSETGVRTLKDEFDKVAAHNQHHLDQIATALHQS